MSAVRRLIIVCPLLLAACGDRDEQEVRAWMKEVDAQTKVGVPPLAEPKTFVPFAYDQKDVLDPFNANKLLAELARQGDQGSGGLAPDTARRKELLENYPLDTVRMVGTMEARGVMYAVLQVDRAVHQVVKGQHVGQNYGVVTAITDNSVTVREVVQDATGDWVQRDATLELQETKETAK
jgi:type IV pilus assembly protein PilP